MDSSAGAAKPEPWPSGAAKPEPRPEQLPCAIDRSDFADEARINPHPVSKRVARCKKPGSCRADHDPDVQRLRGVGDRGSVYPHHA